jgi:uncharacterized protein GlcG (DUF336 family)
MQHQRHILAALVIVGSCFAAGSSFADCSNLPKWHQLRTALQKARSAEKSGLENQMWGTIVDIDGTVCAVAFSGGVFTDQWLGSRVISAQKANTANAFSLNTLVLSTANLYSAVQPGGSLYGLQHSNPVDTDVAYGGVAGEFGESDDPMVGKRIGGVNVFGGGLGLYKNNVKVGGVGVSGDTSCTDHDIAWRLRDNLKLDQLSGVPGVSGDPTLPDNIVYDIKSNPDGGTGISADGFGHPTCINTGDQTKLPPVS